MEVNNTVTDMFTDDLKNDFETDLMFNTITQVGDQIDQVAGLGDSLTDDIIKGEMKRSSVKENHGLFTTLDAVDSITLIEETLVKMREHYDLLIEDAITEGNFSKLKEYTNSTLGAMDKDIYYAQFNNESLKSAIKEMQEIREAFIATENVPFSKSLPPIQQHIIASKMNHNLSLAMIENTIELMENKLQKRLNATEQILSEINDDQFAYEVEETNNEEPVDASVPKVVVKINKDDDETDSDDMEGGVMEESALLELMDLTEGLVSLDDSCSITEGTLRQGFKDFKTILSYPHSDITKGDYSRLRVALMKRVKNATKLEDINYLLKDCSSAKSSLSKLSKNLAKAKDAKDPDGSQKKLQKKMKKGLTPEAVDGQIKWIEDVYIPILKAKKEELKKKKK